MSPDTASSSFPSRRIRPLPRRRLREKLSPEVADTIKYPPSTHETAPLFYYPPYTLKDEGSPPRIGSTSPTQQSRRTETGRNYTPRQNGLGLRDGDDEEMVMRSTMVTRSPPKILTRAARRHSKPDQPRTNAQPPHSATSSADGYDLFENANNKKKRKIPSAGDAILNSTQLLNNEMGSIAISTDAGHSPTSELHSDRAHPHSGTSGFMTNNQGISGPGRGRLGRARNGRSPLRALPDGNSSWTGRAPKSTQPQWAPGGKFSYSRPVSYAALLLFSCIILFPNNVSMMGVALSLVSRLHSPLVHMVWSIRINGIYALLMLRIYNRAEP